MRPRVYIETTIPSYLTCRPSTDPVRLGHEIETRNWWENRRHGFELVASQFVVEECEQGDAVRAADRLALLAGVTMLESVPVVTRLAADLVRTLHLPARATADAAHIAVAAVYGVEYLLTWNCTHLANAALAKRIAATCAAAGFRPPTICTPTLLLGEPS